MSSFLDLEFRILLLKQVLGNKSESPTNMKNSQVGSGLPLGHIMLMFSGKVGVSVLNFKRDLHNTNLRFGHVP